MIGDAQVLAVIAARGGSKGLPGKNLLALGGRPLIEWSVAAARQSGHVDRVILSSDDDAIIAAATAVGCEAPFVRPAALAQDDSSMVDVVVHALDQLADDYGYVVLLQPTSPFRTADDIDGALRTCHEAGAASCVSVCPPPKSPLWMYSIGPEGRLVPAMASSNTARRQELPSYWALNGAVYVVRSDWFRQARTFIDAGTLAYPMPPERSVDIDTQLDFVFAEAIAAHGLQTP